MKAYRFDPKKDWKVLRGTARSQAAIMTIAPGDAEGGPGNRHPKSDQWLLVLAGRGVAKVEGKKTALAPGVLILIEKNEEHEVRNTGRRRLETLNFYAPPAY